MDYDNKFFSLSIVKEAPVLKGGGEAADDHDKIIAKRCVGGAFNGFGRSAHRCKRCGRPNSLKASSSLHLQ
ncbi:hypothetical protein L596_017666 [Steinernema carpocapsae]|uniref:Uncharacterized protein n=1 Tax=Steinernema carpocapsae TaxID=34508 RepID=A0A4V6A1U2_STECR|nr:hypothetical protein L596_017666 [Steinernema carpocapsae]